MKKLGKKIGLLTTLFLVMFLSSSLQGQHPGMKNFDENKDKIKAHKIAFITDKLDLSPAEAEKFWPLYNEHEAKVDQERKGFREKHDFSPDQIKKMSDKDASDFIAAQENHEQEMLDLNKEFNTKLKGVLSPQKILILMESEREFRVELMRKVAGFKGRGPDDDDNPRK